MSGGVLARGFLSRGFCPGVYVRGVLVWGVFVLEPMAPSFGQKCSNHVVFEGLKHLFAERQQGESRFDVSLKYLKMSTKIKND